MDSANPGQGAGSTTGAERALLLDFARRVRGLAGHTERTRTEIVQGVDEQTRHGAGSRTPDDLTQSLSDLADSVGGRLAAIGEEYERLAATLERTAGLMAAAPPVEPAPVEPAEPEPPPAAPAQPAPEEPPPVAQAPAAEPPPPASRAQPWRPTTRAPEGVSEGVRLIVTQMAVAGSGREEIEHRLRDEFNVANPRRAIDEVMGPTHR